MYTYIERKRKADITASEITYARRTLPGSADMPSSERKIPVRKDGHQQPWGEWKTSYWTRWKLLTATNQGRDVRVCVCVCVCVWLIAGAYSLYSQSRTAVVMATV